MADLLIRNIPRQLKQRLADRARSQGRSLSEEAKLLLEKGMLSPPDERKMGTALLELIPEECRGDDLVFEVHCEVSEPPDFK
jgi:plasmid stability protein